MKPNGKLFQHMAIGHVGANRKKKKKRKRNERETKQKIYNNGEYTLTVKHTMYGDER